MRAYQSRDQASSLTGSLSAASFIVLVWRGKIDLNRPFPSCPLSLCQDKSLCETIHIRNEFRLQVHFHVKETYFREKSLLVFKLMHKITRRWPILFYSREF